MVKYIKAANYGEDITLKIYYDFSVSDNPTAKRILNNVLEPDTVDIILNGNVWYAERGSLPKYAKEYLKEYIKRRFGADYLYDVAPPLEHLYN